MSRRKPKGNEVELRFDGGTFRVVETDEWYALEMSRDEPDDDKPFVWKYKFSKNAQWEQFQIMMNEFCKRGDLDYAKLRGDLTTAQFENAVLKREAANRDRQVKYLEALLDRSPFLVASEALWHRVRGFLHVVTFGLVSKPKPPASRFDDGDTL